MRTRTRLAAVSGLAAMAASAGLLLGAAPASAGPNCASGYHCVYYLGINDSARHSYFDSDTDFRNDTFNQLTSRTGGGQTVHNNVASASNSSTGGYESHYYTGVGSDWEGFLFCVNPGSHVDYLPGSLQNRASSLRLRGTTSINCF
ncbi:hypothetical protein [Streptomyces sp. S.PNR 29]|uniref:hypothetical protein n=1 Tax=Streptomyces sp. S.PNR 29 TaxID=2973805 RepID=UPI0025B1B651|nr:hypothetical protein [Streptomyces sp. S.PNR 29]MDN0199921.1 hypothetical protein [Streptomyces sp. S.PNR 29]